MSTVALTIPNVVVLKLGGSVLTDSPAYPRCAEALRRRRAAWPDERLLVVVSAAFGTTDRLQALAAEACPEPDPRLLDLLWSTGERHSVALLALCLRRLGVDATGLDVQQCGIEVPVEAQRGTTAEKAGITDRTAAATTAEHAIETADGLRVNPLPLLHYLRVHPVVVVPGFFGCAPGGAVVSLGRGGSDLSAVVLAAALGARRCELIKDVPGYFSKDPHRYADAVPLARLTYGAALTMAEAGCDLVQPRAVAAAARSGTRLVVRAIEDGGPQTHVGPGAADVEPSRSAAIAAG